MHRCNYFLNVCKLCYRFVFKIESSFPLEENSHVILCCDHWMLGKLNVYSLETDIFPLLHLVNNIVCKLFKAFSKLTEKGTCVKYATLFFTLWETAIFTLFTFRKQYRLLNLVSKCTGATELWRKESWPYRDTTQGTRLSAKRHERFSRSLR